MRNLWTSFYCIVMDRKTECLNFSSQHALGLLRTLTGGMRVRLLFDEDKFSFDKSGLVEWDVRRPSHNIANSHVDDLCEPKCIMALAPDQLKSCPHCQVRCMVSFANSQTEPESTLSLEDANTDFVTLDCVLNWKVEQHMRGPIFPTLHIPYSTTLVPPSLLPASLSVSKDVRQKTLVKGTKQYIMLQGL